MPRSRIITYLDLRTRRLTSTTQNAPDDATVEERFDQLRADAQERMPSGAGVGILWVYCDGKDCGRKVRVERPELPEGWISTPEGEFCPDCKEGRYVASEGQVG